MATSLEGRTIWITGASSGIGEALSYALSREGARLVLTARREEALSRVRAACRHPERHRLEPADLLDKGRLPDLAARVMEEAGPIDVLINNAGVSQRGKALDTPVDIVRRIMELNFFAPVALTRAVAPSMIARHQGHLVSISSVVGHFGTPQRSAYAASKHALQGFMDSLRAELAGRGVAVTVICPGFVRTHISRYALTADGAEYGIEDAGQARGMDPDLCAARIVQAIKRRRPEVYLGGAEIAVIYLKRLVPAAYRRLIQRMNVT